MNTILDACVYEILENFTARDHDPLDDLVDEEGEGKEVGKGGEEEGEVRVEGGWRQRQQGLCKATVYCIAL